MVEMLLNEVNKSCFPFDNEKCLNKKLDGVGPVDNRPSTD